MSAGPVERAMEAWSGAPPDWVLALARACALTSQARVACELDRTPAVVSQVLRNRYPADLARIEERVRGVFMAGRVTCPGLGAIRTDECQDWRAKARAFVVGNPLRVRMYRACQCCPRNAKEPQDGAA